MEVEAEAEAEANFINLWKPRQKQKKKWSASTSLIYCANFLIIYIILDHSISHLWPFLGQSGKPFDSSLITFGEREVPRGRFSFITKKKVFKKLSQMTQNGLKFLEIEEKMYDLLCPCMIMTGWANQSLCQACLSTSLFIWYLNCYTFWGLILSCAKIVSSYKLSDRPQAWQVNLE